MASWRKAAGSTGACWRRRLASGVKHPLRLTALLLLGLTGSSAALARPAEGPPSQAEVESVYLFDFLKFVRWPGEVSEGALRICMAASPAFSAGLEKTVAGEQIDGHPLEVRRVTRPEDVEGCSILFIEAAQKEHEGELLRAAAARPMLTVGDAPGFIDRGGMIQFELVQHRVRFSVNLHAVAHGNLSMSSELLKVALSVRGSSAAGGGR